MKSIPISRKDFMTSVLLMLGAAFSLALVALFAKQLTTFSEFSLVIFLRFFIPFLLLAWVAIVLYDIKIHINHWKIHFLRSLFAVSSQYCLLFYLAHGSLLVGTLLFTTSGLFLPFISRIFFKVKIKTKTLIAILISFVGVAFVLKPVGGLSWLMMIGLLSGLLNACSQAFMHHLSKNNRPFDATLVIFALSSLYSFIIILIVGKFTLLKTLFIVNHSQALWLTVILLSIFTISNQSLRTKAYRYVNKPASLTPFYYTSIPFSALFDWWIYHKIPQWNVYVGLVLIFIAAVIMARRSQYKLKSLS